MGAQKEAIKLAIKDELFNRFKEEGIKNGFRLSTIWLHDDFLPSLSNKEQEALEEVITEMIHEGLIKYAHEPKATYILTEKGINILC
jgi:hypothetical protein